jgi:hypothetical protein
MTGKVWRRGVIALMLVALVAGCASSRAEPTDPEAVKALETAKAAIAEHPEYREYVEFDAPEHDSETGRWTVLVWRNKRSKAGCVIVEIDAEGNITGVAPQM